MRHFCPQRFRRHQSCHRAQPPVPASLALSRECPGGRARVRPAAEGRAGPFRFRKELDPSSHNGTRPYGPSDSGRAYVRNGPARPSTAGRFRPPGHSRPFCVGPAECLRSPAYILLTTCARCKRPAFYKPAASAPLQPFQRDSEVARSVCRASPPRTHASARGTRGTSHPAAAARRSLCAQRMPWYPALRVLSECTLICTAGPASCTPSVRLQKPSLLACGCCRISRSTGIAVSF